MRELFRLIDWMMHLPEDREQRFQQELTVFEERLDALARALVDFRCLDDMRVWLQEHDEPAPQP